MIQDVTKTAARFCRAISERPDMTNATARIGAWLIGAASKTGGFPLDLSLRQIQNGFEKKGIKVEGTGSRRETLRASLDWLEQEGFLRSSEGSIGLFGHQNRAYTMEL